MCAFTVSVNGNKVNRIILAIINDNPIQKSIEKIQRANRKTVESHFYPGFGHLLFKFAGSAPGQQTLKWKTQNTRQRLLRRIIAILDHVE